MEGATALGDHRAGYGPGSPGHDAEVIRNAVIHLTNEQPLVADLPVPPSASDISLVCTNLRTLNGKRPVFADDSASLFVFPYAHIRFLEVPPASLAAAVELDVDSADGANGRSTGTAVAVIANAIAAAAVASPARPQPAGAGDASSDSGEAVAATAPDEDLDTELEIDEDFLRRVREV
jgi:hypothetical protein